MRINAISDVATTPNYSFNDMHEDGKPTFAFSQDELEDLESYDMALDDFGEYDDDDAFVELLLREVTYPYTEDEPNVSSDELQRSDAVADRIDTIRLKGPGVLCDPSLFDGAAAEGPSSKVP
eukprot:s1874_g9.t1